MLAKYIRRGISGDILLKINPQQYTKRSGMKVTVLQENLARGLGVLFIVAISLVLMMVFTGCKLSGDLSIDTEPEDIVIEDVEEDVLEDYDKSDEIVIEDAEVEKSEEEIIEDIMEEAASNNKKGEEEEINCDRYRGKWFIHIQESGKHIWNEVRIHDCQYNVGDSTYTGRAESIMAYVPVPQQGMKTVELGGYFGSYVISGVEVTITAENGSSEFKGVFIHENLAVGTWVNNNSGAGGTWSCFRTSGEFQDYLGEIVQEDLEQYNIDMEAIENLSEDLQ